MATLKTDRIYIPPLSGKCVAYLRESTRPYGRMNANAQLDAIRAMLVPKKAKLLEKYTELEPLTDNDRPELRRAVRHCKDVGATLLVGQLDRMRGGVRWLEFVSQQGIKFRGVDAPHINQISYHLLTVADLHWREELGRRVTASLAQAKADGVSLGGDRGHNEGLKQGPSASALARRTKADARDASTMRLIEDVRHRGVTSLVGITQRLNQMGQRAPRGGVWSPAQVRRIIKKLEGE